jgi:hypothetical protein
MSPQPPGSSPDDWTHRGARDLTPEQFEICRKWGERYGIGGPKITDDRGVSVASVALWAQPSAPGYFHLWVGGVTWCHLLIDEPEVWRRLAEGASAP